MHFSLAALSLLGLTAASPTPQYPAKSTSKGFRLVLDVTDKSLDFHPSVQGKYVVGLHTGAGLAIPGLYGNDKGPVFYQNGTTAEIAALKGDIITDAGQPLSPEGFQLTKTKNTPLSTGTMNFGSGTPGVQLNSPNAPISFLLPQTYLACNSSLIYYQGTYFITINQTSADVSNKKNIPKGCAPIRLLPECAPLEALPKGSYSSHKYAQDSKCYTNVGAVDWTNV